MSPEPELRACPFCPPSSPKNLRILTHAVVCLECDATGPMPKTAIAVRPSRSQVISAWNTRAGTSGTIADSKVVTVDRLRELEEKARQLIALIEDSRL